MERVLVTGHRGMIGSRLMERVEGVGIDLKDGKNMLTCLLPEVDVVYHLAAQSSVEASWADPVHDAHNLLMTTRLVHRYPNAKIIYTASAATNDTSPYGFSKWASAEYLKKFHTNYVICTLPNVYGERGGKSVVDIFKEDTQVVIYGDGLQTRSYVHVEDIAEALALAQDWPTGEYFLGDGVATTVLDLAEGKEIRYEAPRREAREAVLPNTTPNWKPRIRVKDYLCRK